LESGRDNFLYVTGDGRDRIEVFKRS